MRANASTHTFDDRFAHVACRLYRAGEPYKNNPYVGRTMPQPEPMLERVIAELRSKEQTVEAELASFRQRAAAYEAELVADLERTKKRVKLFSVELEAMKGERGSRATDPSMSATSRTQIANEEPSDLISLSEKIRLNARFILKDAACPLPPRKIKEIMESRGIEIQASNPNELIRIALFRQPSEFVNVRSKGWTLVGKNGKPMYE